MGLNEEIMAVINPDDWEFITFRIWLPWFTFLEMGMDYNCREIVIYNLGCGRVPLRKLDNAELEYKLYKYRERVIQYFKDKQREFDMKKIKDAELRTKIKW